MSYISSNDNRLYAAVEAACGRVPTISAKNRFPAVRLTAKQNVLRPTRHDKTGTRSFLGSPAGSRRETEFVLKTYLTAWGQTADQPGYGSLIQAAMGQAPAIHAGGAIASVSSATQISFQGEHGLSSGQGVAIGGELRFVSAVADSRTIEINAPFSVTPGPGSMATATATYKLGKSLPTASIFDCWSPEGAIQRILCGAAVDLFVARVNSDFHEFEFRGPARDLIDNGSFSEGQGELSEFPAEPEVDSFDHTIVPGHMGQVWLGVTPERFYTLTSAELSIDNGVEKRTKEFGLEGMQSVTAGARKVTVDFELFAMDDDKSGALYAAARQRSPIRVMFQLGQQEGQLFGIYLKSVVPEVPQFDDSETRLSWKFSDCRAQGSSEDEVVVAFA